MYCSSPADLTAWSKRLQTCTRVGARIAGEWQKRRTDCERTSCEKSSEERILTNSSSGIPRSVGRMDMSWKSSWWQIGRLIDRSSLGPQPPKPSPNQKRGSLIIRPSPGLISYHDSPLLSTTTFTTKWPVPPSQEGERSVPTNLRSMSTKPQLDELNSLHNRAFHVSRPDGYPSYLNS